MCVLIYICIYIQICIHVYVCINISWTCASWISSTNICVNINRIYKYIFVYICLYTHLYLSIYMYTHINRYTYIHIYLYMYIYIYMYLYIYVYIYTYIYIYKYIYVYICIYREPVPREFPLHAWVRSYFSRPPWLPCMAPTWSTSPPQIPIYSFFSNIHAYIRIYEYIWPLYRVPTWCISPTQIPIRAYIFIYTYAYKNIYDSLVGFLHDRQVHHKSLHVHIFIHIYAHTYIYICLDSL